MKKTLIAVASALPMFISLVSVADDADQVLTRNRELATMNYKRDQLRLQADMAESIKKMRDAGIIVDKEGTPLGYESMQTLADEAKLKGPAKEGNPFQNPGAQAATGVGMPFAGDQFNSLPVDGSPFEQAKRATDQQIPITQDGPSSTDDKASTPTRMELVRVRADSVVIRSSDGDQVLRVGEKINGQVLQRFTTDKAYLKGPSGVQELAIDWARKR